MRGGNVKKVLFQLGLIFLSSLGKGESENVLESLRVIKTRAGFVSP